MWVWGDCLRSSSRASRPPWYHARVMRKVVPFIVMALVAAACGSPERQWYKPGADYTVAEFRRDRASCEKSGKIDEDCLKERGWVPLTPDKEKPPPVTPTTRSRYY